METFAITSGKIRVSDPCYTKDTWCAGVLENVLNGDWVAEKVVYGNDVTGWGDRIGELRIFHIHHTHQNATELVEIDVGVDSGQAGFFDEEQYPDGETGEYGSEETFYGKVCAGTAGEAIHYEEPMYDEHMMKLYETLILNPENETYSNGLGQEIIDEMRDVKVKRTTHNYLGIANVGFGVATHSGYGDGGYRCYVGRNIDGKIVSAKIVFIDPNDEEEGEE